MIVQVTLTLTKRLSVDSVAPTHSISRPIPITKKAIEKTNQYLLMKEAEKLNHLSSPFQVDFKVYLKVLEGTATHWFKCIQEVLS